jgi:pyruvate dehydrogenase E1 component
VDGQYQTLGANDGAFNLATFFDGDPEVSRLVAHMSPAQIGSLRRGGHDMRKLYAAFAAAVAHEGRPTVILAKTKKGYGMGNAGESRMAAHQEKKLNVAALLEFRDRFRLPLTDEDAAALRFLQLPADSPESVYLLRRRTELGGSIPIRRLKAPGLAVPPIDSYASFALAAEGKPMSTTMAIVRLLMNLLRDKSLRDRIVPIVADEARTFGMAALFKQIGIYSPLGQLYDAEDASSLSAYRESTDGQLLEEGITEAGALSSWIAAATSYSTHGLAMMPFYIFYSMFGFQRVGDLIWAAADQRSRGFLLGATAGRTTLGGEGLQHQDGTSQLIASTVPNCRAYDPAFAGELAVILDHGLRQMLERDTDEFYYVTVMNESYPQPSLPAGTADRVIKGLYRYAAAPCESVALRLLGSGAILREVIAAAELLWTDWNVSAEVWSATSFSELAREAQEVERWNRLYPGQTARQSYVSHCLGGLAPIVAATDYVRAYPQLIASYVAAPFVALGTDGFGRSDTRAALRSFFEVDRHHITLAALQLLSERGTISRDCLGMAIDRYQIEINLSPPWAL